VALSIPSYLFFHLAIDYGKRKDVKNIVIMSLALSNIVYFSVLYIFELVMNSKQMSHEILILSVYLLANPIFVMSILFFIICLLLFLKKIYLSLMASILIFSTLIILCAWHYFVFSTRRGW
jgi:hypothetical protein